MGRIVRRHGVFRPKRRFRRRDVLDDEEALSLSAVVFYAVSLGAVVFGCMGLHAVFAAPGSVIHFKGLGGAVIGVCWGLGALGVLLSDLLHRHRSRRRP
jgi:hypothetical protein